jgi:hypothetical protein
VDDTGYHKKVMQSLCVALFLTVRGPEDATYVKMLMMLTMLMLMMLTQL